MRLNEAVVIPTGSEIRDGTVLDTGSPAVIYSLLCLAPLCTIHRISPVEDDEDAIRKAVESSTGNGVDLVVVIGGSGGGRSFSSSLSEDCTHHALESLLDEKAGGEIWGKNGHLWCRLVCGRKNGTLVINVPGPHAETKAAIEAFCSSLNKNGGSLTEINKAMIQAVLARYPENAVE